MASHRRLVLLLLLLPLLSVAAAATGCSSRRCGGRSPGAAAVSLRTSEDDSGGRTCFIESIFNFGDSISDTGNLLLEGGGDFAEVIGLLPYGISNRDGPTGRCSDGLLIVDHIAAGLGVPSLPPFLSNVSLDVAERGLNFAVAGATALSNTSLAAIGVAVPYTASSVGVQLNWFQSFLRDICFSREDCFKKLERTLFLVGEIGGNDYNFAFIQRIPIEEVKSLVPEVVSEIMRTIQTLIGEGARQVVVPGNFPIGCLPSYLTIFGNDYAKDDTGCVSDFNEFARFHNEQLKDSLEKLGQQNSNVTVAYADYYGAFMEIIKNPSAYGFDDGSMFRACCGTGGSYNFNVTQMCGPELLPCKDPSTFISWDGVHLTQAAYGVMANQLFSNIDVLKEGRCREL